MASNKCNEKHVHPRNSLIYHPLPQRNPTPDPGNPSPAQSGRPCRHFLFTMTNIPDFLQRTPPMEDLLQVR